MHPYNPLQFVQVIRQQSTPDWAEENIFLSPRIPTSEPGQWRRSNVAGLCRPGGPVEAMDSPDCETVAVMKGAQTAVTTTAYAWLAKSQSTDPSSALIVMPSANDARDKSNETWRPMWEDSHKLARFLPADRRRNWTSMYQRLNGSGTFWVGANSAGRLASKPIRRLLLDEEDKYPRQFGAVKKSSAKQGGTNPEAGAAALALQRVKIYRKKGLAKIVRLSTPTDDQGGIYEAYSNGDQRKMIVKCPFCRVDQIMEWKNFKVDMGLAKTNPKEAIDGAHYECPHCHHAWSDDDRWNAIDTAVWKPTVAPRDPKCWSFWFPSWCSKFVTVSYLATQWIKAQVSQSALRDFVNSECGEAFLTYEVRIKDSEFAGLEGDYQEGELWIEKEPYKSQYKDAEDYAVFGGVDVQQGYLVGTFRVFHRSGDSGAIWHGTIDQLTTLDQLATKYGARYIMVDQRFRTREIQEFAFNHAGYVPCQGVTARARALFSQNSIDIDIGRRGQGTGREITTLSHDPDQLKSILAYLLQKSGHTWLIPSDYSARADYCAQMTAEKLVNQRWINPHNRPNHAWDSEILCLLGAIWAGFFPVSFESEPAES